MRPRKAPKAQRPKPRERNPHVVDVRITIGASNLCHTFAPPRSQNARPEQRAAAPTDIVDPPAEKPELPVARPPSPRPASSPSGFCDSPHCGLRSDELQLMLRAPQACAHGGVSYGLSHRSALGERSEKENGAAPASPNLPASQSARTFTCQTGLASHWSVGQPLQAVARRSHFPTYSRAETGPFVYSCHCGRGPRRTAIRARHSRSEESTQGSAGRACPCVIGTVPHRRVHCPGRRRRVSESGAG